MKKAQSLVNPSQQNKNAFFEFDVTGGGTKTGNLLEDGPSAQAKSIAFDFGGAAKGGAPTFEFNFDYANAGPVKTGSLLELESEDIDQTVEMEVG